MKENVSKRHCMVVYARYPLGETRVQREAEALLQHGYQVDVICNRFSSEAVQDEHRGVRIYRPIHLTQGGSTGIVRQFFNYLLFFMAAGFKLTQLHRRQRYNSVQVHNLPDFLVFCALFLKLQGVPVILDLHDLMPEFFTGRFGYSPTSLPARLVRLQERLSCKFADHVITVSKHWRQALIERGVPADKCSVVMNVADHHIFYPEASEGPVENSGLRMIYHGTVVYRYGLDLAIQAVDQVREEIPGVHLTILGVGNHVPALKQMIQERNLEQHVNLRNELRPAEELPEIIQQAHVGIVPYRDDVFTDGLLPTKLMEYAALGLPSIAARTTAIEANFGGTMVEFFKPGDIEDLVRCIRELYHNPERMTALKQGSQSFNARYNWPKISAEYAALVERLGTR